MSDIHVVSVSGGGSSAATLLRCFERYPEDSIYPVFADTMWEDADAYRFIDDLESLIGKSIVRLQVGKTPADVSDDQHMIFNSRIAKCTQVLKTIPITNYAKSLLPHGRVFMCIGFNINDRYGKARTDKPFGRLPGPIPVWAKEGIHVKYPLWFYPRVMDVRAYVESYGLRLPEAYDLRDAGHNITSNCAGGCFKAGIKFWRDLLLLKPDTFDERMRWETNKRRDPKFAKYAILQKTENGVKRAYPLEELKQDTLGLNKQQLRIQRMDDDINSDCVVECQVF